ncbi:hypothetical protein BCR39DRAFT_536481 [Naematelia encephala]|uniref:PH domain-containing protein n=1 Tax=Naematelia encephala TaxID=71784 RepID=A0A1Y2B1A8_9TREE|nr:hypothetical protein BCR39DRAFT_536481 [Naematelia encephala]
MYGLASEGESEDVELEDVIEEGDEGEGEGEGEDSDAEADAEQQGQLERGMEGERTMKSGFLYKKQERRKVWKKKWFVLRTGKLAYYKDDREYSLSRVLDLKQIHTVAPVTVKKHPFTFGIVTSKRTFIAKANSQDEMDSWVQAINGARRKLSEREEEDNNKRGMAIPTKERAGESDVHTHPGTFTSVFSTTTQGSVSNSPVTASTGYFTHNPNNQPLPSASSPPTNTLSSQMAKMSLPKTPSGMTSPRLPSTTSVSQPQSRAVSSTSARREPSVTSIGSSGEYMPVAPSNNLQSAMEMISSDEDEAYFSEPTAAIPAEGSSQAAQVMHQVVDPNKVILAAYLMKRSKGRGRKVWRKRWFYLTSQGLTYTKSHMDTRALRYIPLTSVLDALEFDPAESAADSSDSEDDRSEVSPHSRQAYLSSIRRRADDTSTPKKDRATAAQTAAGTGAATEHIFRLITAKRTYVLCAPSEEDEIKWLAAFRALLNRERERLQNGGGPLSPSLPSASMQSQLPVPVITQQPPTPATTASGLESPPITRTASTSPGAPISPSISNDGPPILGREISVTSDPQGQGGQALGLGQRPQDSYSGSRGRSATYTAKSAVADVARRFRDERENAR